jgi:hypothetical protein
MRGTFCHLMQKTVRLARVRVTRQDAQFAVDAMIPDYTGGGANQSLIMPLMDLANYTQLDQRDLNMLEAIKSIAMRGPPDPVAVRAARLDVDRVWAPDDEQKAAIEREIEADRKDQFQVRLSLIGQMTREAGVRIGDAFMSGASTETLLDLMRPRDQGGHGIDVAALTQRVVDLTAEGSGHSASDVSQRLDQITDLLAPFGAIALGVDSAGGYMARERARLETFVRQLVEFQRTARDDFIDQAQRLEAVVKRQLDFLSERTRPVAPLFQSFEQVIKRFPMVQEAVRKARRDAAFALDCWPVLIEIWTNGRSMARKFDSAEPLEQALKFIARNAPTLPAWEVDPSLAEADLSDGSTAKAKQVKELHGWRTEMLDEEMAERIKRGGQQPQASGRPAGKA